MSALLTLHNPRAARDFSSRPEMDRGAQVDKLLSIFAGKGGVPA